MSAHKENCTSAESRNSQQEALHLPSKFSKPSSYIPQRFKFNDTNEANPAKDDDH
jgi:hypothetical protein